MKLPERFTLGGHTIQVEDDYEFDEQDYHGDYEAILKRVRIAREVKGGQIPPDSSVAQTLLHEALHAICDVYLGDQNAIKELHIDVLAQGLLQFLLTSGVQADWLPKQPGTVKWVDNGQT